MPDFFKPMMFIRKLTPSAFLLFVRQIFAGLNGNARFPKAPVPMEKFGAQIETFASLVVEAMDGSRKVIAKRDTERRTLEGMVEMLGEWVSAQSGTDEEMFRSSGFEPKGTARIQTPPLTETIRKILHGLRSGEFRIRFVAIPNAGSYEIRWASAQADGTPGEWTTQAFSKTRGFLTLTGFTPGTVYLFQVRALVDKTFTDWSDSVSKMCV
jgi:hypothetical protein